MQLKTYKDVYQFPLEDSMDIGYITDQKNNFVFQFTFYNEEKRQLYLDVINGLNSFNNPELVFRHEDGYILGNDNKPRILIRGWGNLTGAGAMNLSGEEASNIQDTFAEYLVEQLNRR